MLKGYLWGGSGGNTIRIFIQNKDGTLKEALNLVVRLLEDPYIMPRSHAPLAVLKEKTAGFYAIVLPGSNRILRYDKKTERYEFINQTDRRMFLPDYEDEKNN